MDDPIRAIKITNATRRWIPALLAISTNSPFFEGEKTGFKSSRSMQFGSFPRTNIPVKIYSIESYVSLDDIRSKLSPKTNHLTEHQPKEN